MLVELAIASLLMTQQSQQNDPLEAAVAFNSNMSTYVEEVEAAEREAKQEAQAQAEAERAAAVQSTDTSRSTERLPPLLLTIRANESGGDYSAYNPTGCEGYGCGGAYQMHARYAPTWGEQAGYPGLGSNAAEWPPATQDAVALYLFYSTNPDGAHWCSWTTYC